jgi:hypothetical protein
MVILSDPYPPDLLNVAASDCTGLVNRPVPKRTNLYHASPVIQLPYADSRPFWRRGTDGKLVWYT